MLKLRGFPKTLKARGTSREPLFIFTVCGFAARNGQYKISKTKLSISMIAVTPATESTKASLASW
jgi:hypothetical protein